jgi:hypothetical protein
VHRRAALPSLAKGSREGRCLSKPPQGDDEQQEGQPTRVALDQILTVNDANRLLRPQPECLGTACRSPPAGYRTGDPGPRHRMVGVPAGAAARGWGLKDRFDARARRRRWGWLGGG